MTNRIVLDINGLRVSKPGYDVLTANETQLMFRSDRLQLSVIQTGVVLLPAIEWDSTQGTFINSAFVSYAAGDQNYYPIVLVQRIEDSNYAVSNWWTYRYFTTTDADSISTYNIAVAEGFVTRVNKDSLEFYNLTSTPVYARYAVLNTKEV